MNKPEYGGDFSFGVSLNAAFGICGGIALLPAIAAFWLEDKPVSEKLLAEHEASVLNSQYADADVTMEAPKSMSVGERIRGMGHILTQRPVYQVATFQFVSCLLQDIVPANSSDVQYIWARVEPFQYSLATGLGYVLFSYGLFLVQKYLLNYSWRKMILYAVIAMNVIDAFISFFTIFDIIRNPYFFLGPTVLGNIAQGINYIAGSFVSVEVADPGYEAATYGLLTTVHNVAIPFGVLIGNQIGGILKATKADVEADSSHARTMVSIQYLINYGCCALSLLTLFLLPDGKVATQKLKKYGGVSVKMAVIVFGILAACLLYSTTVNILSMLPSTYCLKFVGGSGCN
jgi:hypothetical protein